MSAVIARDFHSRGEPREALVVQDMIINQEYILPQGYAGVVPSKPPLFHWIAALFSSVSGQVNEVSARLPSVLAACLIAFLCFRLFAAESSPQIAAISVLILATSNEWLRSATTARVDMLLTAALMTAFYGLYRWSCSKYQGYPFLLLLALAVAMLCKGPVGIVLPGLVFCAISVFDRASWKQTVMRAAIVFIPAFLIAALWYLAAYFERPQEFLDKVYYENVARFLGTQEDEPHKSSAIKLYLMLVLGFLPWSLFALIKAASGKKLSIPDRNFLKPSYLILWWRTRSRIDAFSLIIIIVTLLFYSIPEGKRSAYLLPAHPFIAFFLARIFQHEGSMPASRLLSRSAKAISILLIFTILLFLTIILLPDLMLSGRIPHNLSVRIIEMKHSISAYIFAGTLEIVYFALWTAFALALSIFLITANSSRQALDMLICALFLLYFYVQTVIVPAAVNPLSPRHFAKQLAGLLPADSRLISFGEEFYGVSFYSSRKFLRAEQVGLPEGSILVTAHDDMERLGREFPQSKTELIAWSERPVMKFGKRLGIFRVVQGQVKEEKQIISR